MVLIYLGAVWKNASEGAVERFGVLKLAIVDRGRAVDRSLKARETNSKNKRKSFWAWPSQYWPNWNGPQAKSLLVHYEAELSHYLCVCVCVSCWRQLQFRAFIRSDLGDGSLCWVCVRRIKCQDFLLTHAAQKRDCKKLGCSCFLAPVSHHKLFHL